MEAEKEEFLCEIEQRLRARYKAIKEGFQSPPIDKHRLEGFMMGGVFLGVVSRQELEALIEQVHVSIFGKTQADREAQSPKLWRDEAIDYTSFDAPAFERKKR